MTPCVLRFWLDCSDAVPETWAQNAVDGSDQVSRAAPQLATGTVARYIGVGSLAVAFTGASAQATISEQEAHAIGVDAYLYFYPLVTMDLTRRQLTNGDPAISPIQAPMNTFANIGAYPTADMRVVVRPNFDTLYSSAWLDLSKEPVIVSVPETHGRYYL